MIKLFIILCLLSIGAVAQTDSLTTKLKALKALRDSNLITQSDYDQLRLKELKLKPKIENKAIQEPTSIVELKKKVQLKIIGSSLGVILCGIGINRANYFANKPITFKYDKNGNIDQADYINQLSEKKRLTQSFSIFTGVMTIFTAINLATLPIAANKYQKAKQLVSINFNPKGFSFAYRF